MKTSPFQKLQIGFAVSIVLLIGSIILSLILSIQLRDNIDRSENLHKVIHQMDKVLYTHSFCEGNIRAYLVTSDRHFIKEYESNKKLLYKELHELIKMQYSHDINKYNRLLEERIRIMDEKLKIKNTEMEALLLKVLVSRGRQLSDSIVQLKNKVEKEEFRQLTTSHAAVDKNLTYTKHAIIISGIISVLLGLITYRIARKYIEEKQKKVEELSELDKNKNKFFSIISHDLKAPVYQMVQLNKMIAHSYHYNLHKDMDEMINMIQSSSLKLKSLVDNLLLWGKVQMEKIDYSPYEMSIYNSGEQAIFMVEDFANTKNITIVNKIDRTIYVYADSNMVDTVLRNIIHNAIKYSPENSEIVISSLIMDNAVDISITDSGVGMRPEVYRKLLKMENIISMPGTAREEGTGLGLILCKEMIEKNGGSICIESRYHKGTTVKIRLPLFSFETISNIEKQQLMDETI